MKDFTVKFKGLSSGKHEYQYTLTDEFFKSLHDEDLESGEVIVDVLLEKEEAMLTFEFKFKGKIQVMCDRCLELFELPVQGNDHLYVKFGEEHNNTSEEMVYIPEHDHEIDLYNVISQWIITALPMRRIHPEDENGNTLCNIEMLQKIEALTHENIATEEIDPRWEALKKINSNN